MGREAAFRKNMFFDYIMAAITVVVEKTKELKNKPALTDIFAFQGYSNSGTSRDTRYIRENALDIACQWLHALEQGGHFGWVGYGSTAGKNEPQTKTKTKNQQTRLQIAGKKKKQSVSTAGSIGSLLSVLRRGLSRLLVYTRARTRTTYKYTAFGISRS